ncbi:hypothetical protein VN97_g8195 [Penicillium thymicola]|uniref:Uncharacterized protein n=1 Tax=Penicillium thymicola TaxID=293382 RepID=A0AAI9TDC0_PENTH|nr:hypothetical protein VN97_g8195 [Penicillium thymicola]
MAIIVNKEEINKKVIARRRSGNLRSNGTQAEDERDPNWQCAKCRQRQPLDQMPAHPFTYTDSAIYQRNAKYK